MKCQSSYIARMYSKFFIDEEMRGSRDWIFDKNADTSMDVSYKQRESFIEI